jgi:hypothetical protein
LASSNLFFLFCFFRATHPRRGCGTGPTTQDAPESIPHVGPITPGARVPIPGEGTKQIPGLLTFGAWPRQLTFEASTGASVDSKHQPGQLPFRSIKRGKWRFGTSTGAYAGSWHQPGQLPFRSIKRTNCRFGTSTGAKWRFGTSNGAYAGSWHQPGQLPFRSIKRTNCRVGTSTGSTAGSKHQPRPLPIRSINRVNCRVGTSTAATAVPGINRGFLRFQLLIFSFFPWTFFPCENFSPELYFFSRVSIRISCYQVPAFTRAQEFFSRVK